MPKALKWMVLVSIISVIITLLTTIGLGCTTPIRVNGDVRYNYPFLYVQNNDTFDWVDVNMTLNKVYIYEYEQDKIPAGEAIMISPMGFRKPDGTGFNFLTTVPESFSLQCQVPEGTAIGEWEWE